MEKRTKRKNILSSFLTLLITAALLIGSITTAVFAGDYEAGKTGNISQVGSIGCICICEDFL